MNVNYLLNTRTGVVFLYTAQLAKRSEMVPCDVRGKVIPEVKIEKAKAPEAEPVVEVETKKTAPARKKTVKE